MMEEVSWPFSHHMQCIIITVIAAINRVPSVPRSPAKTLYISYLILKKKNLFISLILQMMKPKLRDVTNVAKILTVIKWQSGISNRFLSVSRAHNLNYYIILPFIHHSVSKCTAKYTVAVRH